MSVLLAAAILSAASSGTLLIVGGALDAGNDAVFAALTAAIPVDARNIVIIPAASAVPSSSAAAFARDLTRHGIAPSRILTAQVALVDDPATPTIDESGWRNGASDPEEVAKLTHAGAIWFVGGDQARIVAALVRADGRDTPMLEAIRVRLAAGAVISGSSAGAAIMSRPMITGGDSLGALSPAAHIGEPLELAHGLGFLPQGLVDQHFDTRARLGRLTVALSRLPARERLGLGINENTALVVDLATQKAIAIGAGSVTVLDARRGSFAVGGRVAARNILLGVASGGDTIDLATGMVIPARYKLANTSHAGVRELIDQSRGSIGDRVLSSGRAGVGYRFIQTIDTRVWQGRDAAGTARYTIAAVDFSILAPPRPPASSRISP